MTKVAIITRTKDRPTFLERCLRSVQGQTYKDYVHVVVNDGGDKEVVETAVKALAPHAKDMVRVFHRSKPSNAPDTIFNESINRVDSEYIVIHDDDDTWHPEFLEQAVRHLEESGSMGVVTRADKVSEKLENDGSIIRTDSQQWMPHIKAISLYRQCIDNQMTPIAFIYKRKAYEAVGGFDDTLPVLGDWDFGIRFLMKFDVDYVDPGFALANYHHRKFKKGTEGNTSYAGNDRARYYTNFLMNKYLRQELAEGRLGVGYIMSKLRYEDSKMAQMANKVLPRFVADRLKKRVGN